MAEADCDLCEAQGFRSCDRCAGPAWEPGNLYRVEGQELCGYCAPAELLGPAETPAPDDTPGTQ